MYSFLFFFTLFKWFKKFFEHSKMEFDAKMSDENI